jgi:hypothetical protein
MGWAGLGWNGERGTETGTGTETGRAREDGAGEGGMEAKGVETGLGGRLGGMEAERGYG